MLSINLLPRDLRKITSLLESIEPITRVHGHSYHEARLLFNYSKEDYQLQAQVREAGVIYNPSIDCDTGSYYCTCSDLKPCKHIACLAIWAQEQDSNNQFRLGGDGKNKVVQGEHSLVFEINPKTYRVKPLLRNYDKSVRPFKDAKEINLLRNDWKVSWEQFLGSHWSFKHNFQNNLDVGFPLQQIVAHFQREDQPTTTYYNTNQEVLHFGGYVKLNAIVCNKEFNSIFNEHTKYELIFYYFDPLNKFYRELDLEQGLVKNINRMDLKTIYSEFKQDDTPLAVEYALFLKNSKMTERERKLQTLVDHESNNHLKLIKYTKAKNLDTNVFYLLKAMPRINQTLLFKENKQHYSNISLVYHDIEKLKYFLDPKLNEYIESAITSGPALSLTMYVETVKQKFKIMGKIELIYSTNPELLNPKYWEEKKKDFNSDELHCFIPQKIVQNEWTREILSFSQNNKLVKRNLVAENKILTNLKMPFLFRKKDGGFIFSTRFLRKFSNEYLPKLKEQNIILRLHESIFPYLDKIKTKQNAFIDIESSSGLPWFLGSIKIEGLSLKDTKAILIAYHNKQELLKLSTGEWVLTNSFNLDKIFEILHKVGVNLKKDGTGGKFLRGNIYNLSEFENEIDIHVDAKIKELQEIFNQKLEDFHTPQPKLSLNLEAILRPYQKEGVKFLNRLFSMQVGGILADDMGLGKTIQTLAFIEYVYNKNPNTLFLIVGPLAALNVWENEALKFTPSIPVQIWHGAKTLKSSSLSTTGIIATTYTTLTQNIEKIRNKKFTVVFFDEAQNIKNIKTTTARVVRMLTSICFFCLTGTPIQNHIGELWALMELCFPGLLGSRKNFKTNYGGGFEISMRENLLKKIQPFILRRKKQDVLKELPSKNEILVTLPFHKTQALIYEKTRREALEILKKSGSDYLPQMLSYLTKLRRICCHPDLQNKNLPDLSISSKFTYLKENLIKIKENSTGVLIFSQFTDVLDLVAGFLDQEHEKYFYLSGSTIITKRQRMVKEFQQGHRHFFLISLKAGGTALTLHRADTIIHLDPWWNPAAEDQATDRVHRLGQTRQVFVYKLVIQKSLEEKVLILQNQKKKLFHSLFNENIIINDSISKEEIAEILSDENIELAN